MLVQCPKCKTTYKVSDEIVKGTSPSFRCSRCKHTFEIKALPENAANVSDAIANQTGKNRELTFSFAPAAPESPQVESPPLAKPTQGSDSGADVISHNDNKQPGSNRGSGTDPDNTAMEINTKAKTPEAPPSENLSDPLSPPVRETDDKVLAIEPYRDQPASVTPFLTLFGLLVIFFAFVLAYQKTHPTVSEAWVRSIPILGPSVVRNDHLNNGVLLKSVETRYQNLQGTREVVVLTGVAVNQNPVMIRNVQLQGSLYDHEGKEIERQAMWIGNAVSSQIIRGMTAQDIADLQRLKPLKTFEIPPGDSVPFAIVFLRAGKQVKDARCEVLSADGDT
ncbi:MAG: zinc-ribbon domain-containing protein [Deltaproteobacteria bacterium]|nr:zinc-ribbon domain-containing protein [Deltaproteobacteria bacterium]